MNRSNIRVAVGLSGGVDSAVSAYLLKKQSYEVVGVHLYCYPPRSEYLGSNAPSNLPLNLRGGRGSYEEERLRSEWIKKNGCRADEDKQMALKTALELGIPFQTLDFSEEYNKRVVNYFYREYEAGRTPNPDVLCNSEIKFGLFLDWAIENGFDYVATGHYARLFSEYLPKTGVDLPGGKSLPDTRHVAPAGGGNHAQHGSVNFLSGTSENIRVSIPKDKHKDQTYFLWKLTQKELKHVLFPLSDLTKPEVRKIAQDVGLSVAKRKDSQGICFVGNVDAREFLSRRLKEKVGEVRNTKGEVIGSHKGVWFYTIGQRGGWTIDPKTQKIKIEKTQRGDITPIYYVISKDAKKNELVVGMAGEAVGEKFRISETNWIGQIGVIGQISRKILVRIRHSCKLIPASLSGNEVTLDEPQRGVAPGQSAVFYSEDGEMLGGGVIS